MMFANDEEDCLICHGVNVLADLQFTVGIPKMFREHLVFG
jgi:hypothetical protein